MPVAGKNDTLNSTMEIHQGDCLEILKTLSDNSIDSLITDPPAGIAFMNKEWDKDRGGRDSWIKWMAGVMVEAKRVLKPGAHGFVWALPRTSHWTATALEDAGFEIRDIVMHLFGSGFPKSLNVSKAIDKMAGAEREVIGTKRVGMAGNSHLKSNTRLSNNEQDKIQPITAPSTPEAKQWDGYGTALKPACEHWILIRRPLAEKTVAKNVLKWGAGALNIDVSRIETNEKLSIGSDNHAKSEWHTAKSQGQHLQGRFPANLTLDEYAARMLDEQSGNLSTDSRFKKLHIGVSGNGVTHGLMKPAADGSPCYSDSGGASRFFYCAKASKSERNAGLKDMEDKILARSGGAQAALKRGEEYDNGGFNKTIETKNNHPTVKAIKLMKYLINMVTPPNGTVLDPFMGSGSTGVAAKELGFEFVGIEQEKEYCDIAKARLESVLI